MRVPRVRNRRSVQELWLRLLAGGCRRRPAGTGSAAARPGAVPSGRGQVVEPARGAAGHSAPYGRAGGGARQRVARLPTAGADGATDRAAQYAGAATLSSGWGGLGPATHQGPSRTARAAVGSSDTREGAPAHCPEAGQAGRRTTGT